MLQDIAAYAAAAELTASPLRFGAWLRDNFGTELVAARRARERAVRALELGPPVVIEPIATAAATPRAMEAGAQLAMAAASVPMEAAAQLAMAAAAPAAMEAAAQLAMEAGAHGAELAARALAEPPSPWAGAQPPLARPRQRWHVPLLVRGALLFALAVLVIAGCYLAAR
jgi:eukaryotic-like serine/threonine-protein kinase